MVRDLHIEGSGWDFHEATDTLHDITSPTPLTMQALYDYQQSTLSLVVTKGDVTIRAFWVTDGLIVRDDLNELIALLTRARDKVAEMEA